ncbi:MAG: hypothetical protein FRX49_11812 [Trebouxia sp. A1-2]|nr:MAG: hypothetical protein FRX49_11812 [Trebouxia sp. A1-2]
MPTGTVLSAMVVMSSRMLSTSLVIKKSDSSVTARSAWASSGVNTAAAAMLSGDMAFVAGWGGDSASRGSPGGRSPNAPEPVVSRGHTIQGFVHRQLLQRTRQCQESRCALTPGGCSECLAGPAKCCTRSPELGAEVALSKPERLPRLLVLLATEWLDDSTSDARDSGPKVRLQPCLLDSDVTDCDMPQQKTDRLHDGLLPL